MCIETLETFVSKYFINLVLTGQKHFTNVKPYEMSCGIGVLRFELERRLSFVKYSRDVPQGDVHLLIQVQRTQGHFAGHVLADKSNDLKLNKSFFIYKNMLGMFLEKRQIVFSGI